MNGMQGSGQAAGGNAGPIWFYLLRLYDSHSTWPLSIQFMHPRPFLSPYFGPRALRTLGQPEEFAF